VCPHCDHPPENFADEETVVEQVKVTKFMSSIISLPEHVRMLRLPIRRKSNQWVTTRQARLEQPRFVRQRSIWKKPRASEESAAAKCRITGSWTRITGLAWSARGSATARNVTIL
jgi:hypothetical protein